MENSEGTVSCVGLGRDDLLAYSESQTELLPRAPPDVERWLEMPEKDW